jgi:hypothetical protein
MAVSKMYGRLFRFPISYLCTKAICATAHQTWPPDPQPGRRHRRPGARRTACRARGATRLAGPIAAPSCANSRITLPMRHAQGSWLSVLLTWHHRKCGGPVLLYVHQRCPSISPSTLKYHHTCPGSSLSRPLAAGLRHEQGRPIFVSSAVARPRWIAAPRSFSTEAPSSVGTHGGVSGPNADRLHQYRPA